MSALTKIKQDTCLLYTSIVQRSQRQSAVAAAAYQSGEKLFCEYDQQVKHYPEKRGIVHNEILLPANAPRSYADRNTLWNAAEAVEKQWNSQLARRWVLTIPREIPPDVYKRQKLGSALKIDSRWKSDRFRNSMAHYKLGIVLKESDLIISDAMFGLTEKIFGEDYYTVKKSIYKELEGLAKQIGEYLDLPQRMVYLQ